MWENRKRIEFEKAKKYMEEAQEVYMEAKQHYKKTCREEALENEVFGEIKKFIPERAFGFISYTMPGDEEPRELFVHKAAFVDSEGQHIEYDDEQSKKLEGRKVSFVVGWCRKKSKERAEQVRVLDEDEEWRAGEQGGYWGDSEDSDPHLTQWLNANNSARGEECEEGDADEEGDWGEDEGNAEGEESDGTSQNPNWFPPPTARSSSNWFLPPATPSSKTGFSKGALGRGKGKGESDLGKGGPPPPKRQILTAEQAVKAAREELARSASSSSSSSSSAPTPVWFPPPPLLRVQRLEARMAERVKEIRDLQNKVWAIKACTGLD